MSGILGDWISGHKERLEPGKTVHSRRESSECGRLWLTDIMEEIVGVLSDCFCFSEIEVKDISCNQAWEEAVKV